MTEVAIQLYNHTVSKLENETIQDHDQIYDEDHIGIGRYNLYIYKAMALRI